MIINFNPVSVSNTVTNMNSYTDRSFGLFLAYLLLKLELK